MDAAQQIETAHTAHEQIGYHQIRLGLLDFDQCLFCRLRGHNIKPVPFQPFLQQQQDIVIVVNDEYPVFFTWFLCHAAVPVIPPLLIWPGSEADLHRRPSIPQYGRPVTAVEWYR